MISGQANFLQSLGWAVLNSLWQMALLWVIYQFISGIFKSAKSSFRSSLASLLLMTGFAMFVYTFFSFFRNPGPLPAIFSSSIQDPGGYQQITNGLQNLLPAASVLYLVLLIIPLSHFIKNYRYVQVIRNFGLTKMDVQWRMFIKKVSYRMGIHKQVYIWVSEFVSSPVTIGFLKPVILVPLAAMNRLSTQQMEAVLLHELSHIRRHDYLINLIINFIQAILYFNPFVKAFVKIVEREREKSCDEMVLQFQYDSYDYATALLTLEKTHHEYKPLALGVAGKKNDLLQRVELIMGVKSKPVPSFNKLAGLLAGLICIFSLNALLNLSKPQSGKTSGSFAQLASPFPFFTSGFSESKTPAPAEQRPAMLASSSREGAGQSIHDDHNHNYIASQPLSGDINENLAYRQAGFEPVEEILPLKKYEEAQVKAAMDASKKVLENEEWKALEKNIADFFTQKEKEELKITYQKELDKMDWNKWENKLRLAYDKVDWTKVNDQLTKAVNNIRIDSLQKVYNDAICRLDMTQQELSVHNLPGIPDTDITLKVIEDTKQQVQQKLNRLKIVRNKRIVHL